MMFAQDREEFSGELDHPVGVLGGHRLRVVVSKLGDEREPVPAAMAVLETILEHLEEVVAAADEAVRRLLRGGDVAPGEMDRLILADVIAEPYIWIDGRGECHDLAAGEWTLIVHQKKRRAAEVIHLEFTGGELRECWEANDL